MIPSRAQYLYAIVSGAASLDDLRGVTGEAIEVVLHAGLGAVVGEVAVEQLASLNAESSEAGPLGDLARCHDVVVRVAMVAAAAALPFRLGTLVADRGTVSRYLAERAGELEAALAHVAGCQEWGVTVCEDGAERARGSAAAGASSGTAYLMRKRQELADAEARRRAREQAKLDVAAELRAQSIDAAAGRYRRDGIVLDESYLVRREAEPAFVDAVDRCGDRLLAQGLRLSLSGPWPPYSFSPAAPEVARV